LVALAVGFMEGTGLGVSDLAALGLIETEEKDAVPLSHARTERDTVSVGDLDRVALEDDERLGVRLAHCEALGEVEVVA
jgi:hypothetical protein